MPLKVLITNVKVVHSLNKYWPENNVDEILIEFCSLHSWLCHAPILGVDSYSTLSVNSARYQLPNYLYFSVHHWL